MSNKNKSRFNDLFGLFAFFTIKALLEDDSSKVISKDGASVLKNKDLMSNINSKIDDLEKSRPHNKVEVSLD